MRHIALPAPGDWRQFCIQASRIHARALDLDRPLWEAYVIEGLDRLLELPRGSFALLIKIHHAAIDVEGSAALTQLLHDTSPGPAPTQPPVPWFPEPLPGRVALVRRGLANALASPFRLAGPAMRALARFAPTALAVAGDIVLRPERMPVTRFNSAVSPHRVFETRRFARADFERIRALAPGATLDDAVLAVCAGGLRRYLHANGELPPASLTAIAPYWSRGAGESDGHGLTWMRLPLGTDLADPVARLAFIAGRTSAADTAAGALHARALGDVGEHAPAATLALASKMLARAASTIGRRTPLANCTVTQLAGPTQPLYLLGARMTYYSAIMPIADGMGLVFAVTGHEDRIVISPTACRELLPDPESFAQCLRESFEECLAAARATAGPGAPLRRRQARAPTGDGSRPRPRSASTDATAPRAARGGRPPPTAPAH